jgi:chromosomal replication initiation ATPase DnaA
MAEQALGDGAWQPPVPIRIATVVDVICEELAVSRAELMSSSRHRKVVLGRALVAFLGRDMTTHSYPEIARELGRAYHSSVHTAEQRFKRQLEANTPVVVIEGKPLVEPRELLDQLRHAIRRANARS